MLNLLIRFIKENMIFLMMSSPSLFGIWLRKRFYGNGVSIKYYVEIFGAKSIQFGNDINIDSFCRLVADKKSSIKISDGVSINRNVLINARGGGEILIGKNVLIGPNVVIRSNNHIIDDIGIPIKYQGVTDGYIILEDDVWIGANVVILPNVRIGKGAVVGAGAVVTKDIEPYTIAAGIPAKKIKSRL